jgi:hypothetical protein
MVKDAPLTDDSDSSARIEIILALDWFDELQRFVPTP